jgi:hypothetical protein
VRIRVRDGETADIWIFDCRRGRAIAGLAICRDMTLAHCCSNDMLCFEESNLKVFVFLKCNCVCPEIRHVNKIVTHNVSTFDARLQPSPTF